MQTAKDIMTSEVITISPETEVAQAAKLLLTHRINGLPVVNEVGELVGILCQSDFFGPRDFEWLDLERAAVALSVSLPLAFRILARSRFIEFFSFCSQPRGRHSIRSEMKITANTMQISTVPTEPKTLSKRLDTRCDISPPSEWT